MALLALTYDNPKIYNSHSRTLVGTTLKLLPLPPDSLVNCDSLNEITFQELLG